MTSKRNDQIALLFALRLTTLVGAGLVASACPSSVGQAALMFVQACATISSRPCDSSQREPREGPFLTRRVNLAEEDKMATVFVAIAAAMIALLVAGALAVIFVAGSNWRGPPADEKGP